MSNLTTRKIVLGLLMVLVLAFSVQGIAEAQSVSVSGDGSTTSTSSGTTVITDYRDRPDVERSFTIRVSSAKNGENVTIGPTGATLTEVEVTSAPSPQTAFDDGDNPDSDTPTGIDAQIVPAKGVRPGSPQTITFNGLGKPDSHTATGSWTIKVTYQVEAFGQYMIDIGGTVDSDVAGSPITAYVVRSDTLSRNLSFDAESTDTPVVGTSRVTFDVGGAPEEWTRVDLRVTGGKLYLDGGQYLSSNKLFTVSQRKEFTSLSMFADNNGAVTAELIQDSGRVAKITATIPGSDEPGKTYTVTSFASAITVEQVSGNHQFGYTNQGTNHGSWGKLQNPLVVRVVDGHQTNKGVEGQWVRFSIESPAGGARLRAVSRALLWGNDPASYGGADNLISAADDNENPLIVKTDGSGRASVYLLPGATANTYTVTYAVMTQTSPTALGPARTDAASSPGAGAINEQFTATAILDPGTTRDYEIDRSGSTSTPTIRRAQGDTPMTANVNDSGGSDAGNVQVDFSVTGGRITLTPGSNHGTSLSTVTDSGGDARVWVQASGNSVAIVTARIAGNNEDAGRYAVTFLRTGPYIELVSGDDQDGALGGRLEDPLVVRVLDGRGGSPIPDQIVRFNVESDSDDNAYSRQFIPVPGTYVFVTEGNRDIFDETPADMPAADSIPRLANALRPTRAVVGNGNGQNIFVQTDSSGEAQVYLRLGSADDPNTADEVEGTPADLIHRVTATTPDGAPSNGVRFRADAVDDARQAKLEIVSGDGQSADKGDLLDEPLVVRVRTVRGFLIPGILLEFTALDGTLVTDPDHDTRLVSSRGGGNQIRVRTGSDGEARVDYNVGQLRIAREVSVEVVEEQGDLDYDFAIEEVRFGVNGGQGTGGGPAPAPAPAPATRTITLTLSSTTGEPGDEIDVTVSTSSATPDFVVIDDGDFSASDFDDLSGITPHETTLTLPDEEGEYDFFAVGPGGVTSNEVTVTVEAGILGTISITQIGAPSNGAQSFSITVVDTDSARISGALTVRVSGSGFTTRNVDTLNGIGNARLTLPTAASLYTLTASAEGYTSGTTQVRIAGTGQQQVADEDEEEVEEEVTVAAVPDSIEITGPSTRSGTVNEALDTPLLVRVLDDDGDGLEGARVFYRVTGRGRISDGSRGGRSVGVVTDDDGYARANFTPTAGGSSTVRVNTDDVSRIVTFTITAGSASSASSASGARDSGTGGTPGTISPVVHVGAASRPPMLWVDGGAIYALVGASPQRFAASVDNALNIVVGGGKVYWTEKTGESGGTINSANLNGSGVTELASIFATPMGIAVDVTNSKLYWTNSAGRIQSANLDGSRITNVIPGGLETPMDLALAGGNAYWTQGGNVRFVNLRGTKQIRNISTGTDTAGSLVIGGGKVYWTETTGESGGTVNSANLNGTGATQLASILAAPIGIAVDGSRSKLYWSNARGRIQSANLDGSGIKNVVSGLGSPGELVLSNSIATPTATPTTTRTTTTASKYDLNSDGAVDNADAALVADAMGTSNTRYDVNGDGTVNFLDLLLVFDNRDPGAAGAPTIVGMKLSAAQMDIIEEQIDLLIATNDRSPAAMRTLVYLQQLLVTARPEKTQLLANYPNPFNPETWIPYELATDTNVRLTIYNTQGVVIRSLQFGHQSAGYYTGRDRAAYWDGRNALGEQVASGLYFYQLETDEMSLMRKMVILK